MSTLLLDAARLMRLHQPAGFLLLFWPCAWVLFQQLESTLQLIYLLAVFFLGAVVMRSFGCVVNDLADVKFDQRVARTQTRPLANGAITKQQALFVACVLLLIAALLALLLANNVFAYAFLAVPLVIAYPLMKRFTYWPQIFLALTFNFGALLASVAVHGYISFQSVLIYLGACFWTLAYDTIYAYQDIEDDTRIGVKSSARALGKKPLPFLWTCYTFSCVLIYFSGAGIGLFFFAAALVYQLLTLDINSPNNCLKHFKLNAWVGFLPILG